MISQLNHKHLVNIMGLNGDQEIKRNDAFFAIPNSFYHL